MLLMSASFAYCCSDALIGADDADRRSPKPRARGCKGAEHDLLYVLGDRGCVPVSPLVSVAIYVAVALMWLVPDKQLRALIDNGLARGTPFPTSIPKEKTLDSWHGTTILGVKKGGKTVIAGDGQVSMGNTVMKPNAKKVRRIGEDGKVIGGFAGATADAFTLFERLEKKLEQYNGQLLRAAVELAKDWRTDKYLRNLEALMIVADAEQMLILTGNGDVLEPEGGIAAIGSGGNYALSAAKALADYEQDPEVLARRAMQIASEVCVFTNDRLTIETVGE